MSSRVRSHSLNRDWVIGVRNGSAAADGRGEARKQDENENLRRVGIGRIISRNYSGWFWNEISISSALTLVAISVASELECWKWWSSGRPVTSSFWICSVWWVHNDSDVIVLFLVVLEWGLVILLLVTRKSSTASGRLCVTPNNSFISLFLLSCSFSNSSDASRVHAVAVLQLRLQTCWLRIQQKGNMSILGI